MMERLCCIKLQYQVNPDSSTSRFNYDADGNLISFTKSARAEELKAEALKASNNVILTLSEAKGKNLKKSESSNQKPNESAISGQHSAVSENSKANTYYYHLNGHSDVKSITDAQGHELASYSYDCWGRIISENGTLAYSQPFRYASYYWDSDSSQYYLIARYYQARLGRFLSRDPFSGYATKPQSQNSYVYCENDPVNKSDPSGQDRKVLNVPEYKQKAGSNWCWATCIQMAIAKFKGKAPTQDEIVKTVKKRKPLLGDTGTMAETLKGLKAWKLTGTIIKDKVNYDALKGIIDKGKLIIAGFNLYNRGEHMEIIKGYNISSEFSYTGVIYNDPFDGKGHGSSYYNFCYYNGGYTSGWVNSIYNISN